VADLAENGRRESPHNPSFLPDGRHFVYVVQRTNREDDAICVGTIDGGPPQCFLKPRRRHAMPRPATAVCP
jgi:hypothetical protein